MAKMKNEQFSHLGDIELKMEDLIFGVQEINPGNFNFLFNSKVNKDDAEGIQYQDAIARLLGLVAEQNPNMMNIISKAFSHAVTELAKKEGARTDSIMVKIINEDEKPDTFPKLVVTTDGKYKS